MICVKAPTALAGYFGGMKSKKTVTLDVREDVRRGREPFGRIMQAVAGLKQNEDLLLIAPFEPRPLFGVLAQQGFAFQARQTDAGDWEVRFTRDAAAGPGPAAAPAEAVPPADHAACAGTPVVEVDARGLEPPQPMVKILEALATLPAGARLRARTDRRPMHLYAQLEARGFLGETDEQEDGSFVTLVRSR